MLAISAQWPIANFANKIMFARPALVPTFLKTVEHLVNVPIRALLLLTICVFAPVVQLNIMAIAIPVQLLLAHLVNKIMFAPLV